MEQIHFSVDRCVVCGSVVEEGRWVCAGCEEKWANMPKPVGRQPEKAEKTKKSRWCFWRKRTKK